MSYERRAEVVAAERRRVVLVYLRGGETTAKEIAAKMGTATGIVTYALRVLQAQGLARCRTVPIGGGFVRYRWSPVVEELEATS
jgi:GTP-sensing pleiotropic transcriptional regulator CodY